MRQRLTMAGLARSEILPAPEAAIDSPAVPDEAKASASAWYALAVLIGTTLFAFVDRQVINLIAPTLQRDLGLSDLQLGIMQGLGLALFASAASYPIGWLSDRFGRRLVLGCCILFWSLSTAACAFQTSFTGIFIATAGIAIGEAALTPIIFSMLPDLFPERQRNTANFIFFGAVLLGAAAGLALGGATLGWLADHQHALPGFLAEMDSWRTALILVSVPAPLFVLLLTTIRMRGSSGKVAATDGDGSSAGLDQFLPYIRMHWRAVACVYAAIASYGLVSGAGLTWLPVALPRIFPGIEISALGIQMGICVAVGTLSGLALPAVGTRLVRGDPTLRPLVLARAFLIAAIPPTLFLPFAWAPWQIFVAIGIQLAIVIGTAALMPGLLQQLSPPGLRSRILSILGIISSVTAGLSPLLVGILSEQFDWPAGVMFAVAVVGLAGAALGTLLLTLAPRHFLATVAALKAAEATG